MRSLVHDGERYVLTRFRYQCLLCDGIVESTHVRDFVSCPCGALSLDGGLKEGRILGSPNDMRDVSVWTTEQSKVLPQAVLDGHRGF